MAAQSRITQLRTGGFGDLYGKDRDGVHKDIYPLDAEENSEDAANLYYVLSEENSDTAYVLLPESSVERDLWMHNWLIEFNPNTGSIYAVFYSEESIVGLAGADPMARLDALRVKSERLEDGAWIGYYGGDLTHVDAVDPDAMRAEVVIVNKEKLTAYFYCHTLSSEKPSFTVTITDCAGNKFTKQFAANEISQDSGTKFSASWVLDSLDAGGSFYTQTQGKLLCGTKIDVRLDTSLQRIGGKRLTDKDIQSTNSLFDYRSNDNTVAYIAYGRHLQNLDNNTSQVETNKTASNMIRSAIQVDDISFLENDADPECFYSVYGDRLFQPIHNSSIHSYAGQKIGSGESGSGGIPAISGLHIETTDNRGVGLFSSFTGTIQDLLVTGPRVLGGGSNVGVLVGSSSGKTQISHVQVFLSTLLGDLDRAGTAGEVALSLRLTYTWDAGDGVNADPVESTLVIPVVIYPSDVLGLGDGTANQEVTLPHRPADGEFTSEARAEGKEGPELESAKLFLYASNRKGTEGNAISYTDLGAFDVEKAELNLGDSYREMTKVLPDTTAPKPAADSFTLDGITVSVDRTVVTTGTRNQNFVYRPVAVTGDSDAQWSLRLTLRPKSSDGTTVNRTYALVYHRPNDVRFCFQSEDTQTLLKQIRVEQGQDLSKLDQDELDGELLQLVRNAGLDAAAGLAEGYHWTWRLPEGTVTENKTILQEAGPIRFYVAYDAGYDDYEWDDNVPMENSVFTYDSSTNILKVCEYQRPGYEFAGWAGQNGVTFTPGPFADRLDSLTGGQKIEQGQIVTLRALWTPASYTVSYNGNFPGWDSPDGEAGNMEASRYSIGMGDSALPACGFTRSGYRFVGWAFEADAAQAALTHGATLEDAMKQGGSHILYQNVTLYAVWEQEEGDQQSQEEGTEEQEDLEEGGENGQKEPILPETPEQPAEEPEDKKQEPVEEANRNETEA